MGDKQNFRLHHFSLSALHASQRTKKCAGACLKDQRNDRTARLLRCSCDVITTLHMSSTVCTVHGTRVKESCERKQRSKDVDTAKFETASRRVRTDDRSEM